MENTQNSNPMAIVGLVAGILAIVLGILGWTAGYVIVNVIGIILGIVGIVCGALGMKAAKVSGKGKGMATAGMVCGIVGTVFTLITLPCACAAQELRRNADATTDALNELAEYFESLN